MNNDDNEQTKHPVMENPQQAQVLCSGNGRTYSVLTNIEMEPAGSQQSIALPPVTQQNNVDVQEVVDYVDLGLGITTLPEQTSGKIIPLLTYSSPRTDRTHSLSPPHKAHGLGITAIELHSAPGLDITIVCEEVTVPPNGPSFDSSDYTRCTHTSESDQTDKNPECTLGRPSENRPHLNEVLNQSQSISLDGCDNDVDARFQLKPVNREPLPPENVCKNSSDSWEMAALKPILPIKRKDKTALLYKDRFGSGNKGKCIKFQGQWLTPIGFEIAGGWPTKDWKQNIRFQKKSLHELIDKGYLEAHSPHCKCPNCTDFAVLTEPVKLSKQPKRKRRTNPKQTCQPHETQLCPKLQRMTTTTAYSEASSSGPSLPSGGILPASSEDAWMFLESRLNQIINASVSMKGCVQEMWERSQREKRGLQFENSTRTHVDTHEISFYEAVPVQVPLTEGHVREGCQNCHQPGSLICPGCNTAWYCSTICQHIDWPYHTTICPGLANFP